MDKKTVERVFDRQTLMNIHNLFNKGIFREFGGPVADGKEARVFLVYNDEPLAIKVYKLETATFQSINEYIKGDPRFWHIGKNHRTLINAWVKKEFGNLKRLYDAGVKVPKAHAFKGNVLVMEFIGGKIQAPQIRNAKLKNPEKMFWALVEDIKKTFQIAKLVHADLSEYNILVRRGKHCIIDVGQAVDIKHPLATKYLWKDILNVTRFFSKWISVKPENIFEYVTGKKYRE